MSADGVAIAILLATLYTMVLGALAGVALAVAAAILLRMTRLGRALKLVLEDVARNHAP